ncbi:hypothetical protein ACWC5F_23485 [Streptomyces sp. NPDC001272]
MHFLPRRPVMMNASLGPATSLRVTTTRGEQDEEYDHSHERGEY